MQTSKTQSLSGDLKTIAEALIADKFGVKEEVVEEEPQYPFHSGGYGIRQDDARERTTSYAGNLDGFHQRQRGYYHEIKITEYPWGRTRVASIRIDKPTADSLMEAMHRFDLENIRGRRQFHVSWEFFHELITSDGIHQGFQQQSSVNPSSEKQVVGQMFGCAVVIDRSLSMGELIAEYR